MLMLCSRYPDFMSLQETRGGDHHGLLTSAVIKSLFQGKFKERVVGKSLQTADCGGHKAGRLQERISGLLNAQILGW